MSVFDSISPNAWTPAVSDFKRFHVPRFLLNPKQWSSYPNRVPGLTWKRVRFNQAGVAAIPDNKKGIYTFVAEPTIAKHNAIRYLLYVGETHNQSLRTRCKNYLAELTNKKPRIHIYEMLTKWPDHLWIHYAVVTNEPDIEPLEEELIAAFLPPFNRKFPATVRGRMKAVFS
jgi:hypothetical protein